MGIALSKAKPPTVKQRDNPRVLAASEHIDPIREALVKLGEKIQGQVLLAPNGKDGSEESEAYHTQRERTFYLNDANYPSAIVLVETAKDVAETIRAVQAIIADDGSDRYKLCIAGGCHSNYCMVEQSITMDLQLLASVTVDTDAKTIAIEGGAKIGQAHYALKGTGLGFATGTNPDTGVSGLTMAGGAGYLGGQAGYSCDTVVQAKVVLPSGELVTATDDNDHKDLLRAVRGGGGNFGVVVEWTFKLYDVSSAIGGTVVHMAPTVASLRKVLTNYATILENDMPDQAGSICACPAGAPVFVNVVTMIGDGAKNVKSYKKIPFLAKMSSLGAWFRISNNLGPKDYIDEITVLLEHIQQRTHGMAIGAMVYSFDEQMREAIVHFTRVDYPKSKKVHPTIICACLSGEMRRNDGSRSSIRHRKAQAWILVMSAWEPDATEVEKDSIKVWAERVKAKIMELGGEDGPHNFCDTDGRRIKFFTDEQRDFLSMAKTKYDPTNLLSLNKNIISHSE